MLPGGAVVPAQPTAAADSCQPCGITDRAHTARAHLKGQAQRPVRKPGVNARHHGVCSCRPGPGCGGVWQSAARARTIVPRPQWLLRTAGEHTRSCPGNRARGHLPGFVRWPMTALARLQQRSGSSNRAAVRRPGAAVQRPVAHRPTRGCTRPRNSTPLGQALAQKAEGVARPHRGRRSYNPAPVLCNYAPSRASG